VGLHAIEHRMQRELRQARRVSGQGGLIVNRSRDLMAYIADLYAGINDRRFLSIPLMAVAVERCVK